MRVEGKDIYHLGFGEAPFPVPECLQQGLRENVDKAEYLPVEGELYEILENYQAMLWLILQMNKFLQETATKSFTVKYQSSSFSKKEMSLLH